MITEALAALAVLAAVLRDNKNRLYSMLDAYPLDIKRFTPTKKYLRTVRKELRRKIFKILPALILFAVMQICFLFRSDYAFESTSTTILFAILPTIVYASLYVVFDDISDYLVLKKYEKINESRLSFDGPANFPVYSPDNTLPLSVFIDKLILDKCGIGYRIDEVDAFFKTLSMALKNGDVISAEAIERKSFHRASVFELGYSIPDVDEALDYIAKRVGEDSL